MRGTLQQLWYDVLLLVGCVVKGMELIAAMWIMSLVFASETGAAVVCSWILSWAWLADTLPGLLTVLWLRHQRLLDDLLGGVE